VNDDVTGMACGLLGICGNLLARVWIERAPLLKKKTESNVACGQYCTVRQSCNSLSFHESVVNTRYECCSKACIRLSMYDSR